MRSLTLKLTLAFVFVSLAGMLLAAVIFQRLTRTEFDRFLVRQQATGLVADLAEHYQKTGNWQDCNGFFQQSAGQMGGMMDGNDNASPGNGAARRWGMRRNPLLVAAVDGEVVCGPASSIGSRLDRRDLRQSVPIEVDGKIIGYLVTSGVSPAMAPPSPELAFVQRLNQVILVSGLVAGAIALVLGLALARTITRPLRELNDATRVISQGKLGVQVAVRSADEIGSLASSFNQMSADLDKSNLQRKQMTADIAHDLRTPLTLILGYTEALSDGKLQGTPEMFGVMHREANHLNHLIDDLRLISLADAGELTLERTLMSPQALVERAAAAFRAQAQDKAIDLQCEAAPSLPQVNVDPERIAQVLGNLITNALRYTPAGGRITVSASRADNHILLAVRDSGPGISPNDLPHIFDRFYRGDRSRSPSGASGLGLTIARSLVEAHGGSLQAESQIGQGTTLSIRLPLT